MRALSALLRHPLTLSVLFLLAGGVGGWAADNYHFNEGTQRTMQCDDVGGVCYQGVKLYSAEDGSSTAAYVTANHELQVKQNDPRIITSPVIAAGSNLIGKVDVNSFPVTSGSASLAGVDQTATVSTAGAGAVALQVTGSYVATLLFEGTVDGSTWVAADFWPAAGSTAATQTVNGTGVWVGSVGGFQSIRVRANPYTSGTAVITLKSALTTGKMLAAFAGGAGGTSSNFGAAFPAAGTAAGFSDGTNMQAGRAVDADTGGGTVYVQGVNLLKRGAGGPVELGTSADPIRTDPTGTTTQPMGGNVAHDGVDSGNPNKIGCRARSASIAQVAQDDRSDCLSTLDGKIIIQPWSAPELITRGSASTINTSDTSLVAACGAGCRNYITNISCANSSSTVSTVVEVKTNVTVIWRSMAPSVGGTNMMFNPPLRGGTNEAIQFAALSAASTLYCSANGYQAP